MFIGGIINAGIDTPIFSNKNINLSFLTGIFNGALRSFQLGISSSSAVVWKTLPDKINEALIDVGINDPDRVKNSYSFELSGGMAQRVVIALATFSKPRLLFADEPTTDLDVTVERQLLDNFFDFVKNKSMTLVLVTHDLGIVAQYCDEALVMYKGEIVEKGSVNEIFKNPRDAYTQQLIKASSEDISWTQWFKCCF